MSTPNPFTLRDALALFLKHPSPFLLVLICGSCWVLRATLEIPWTNTETAVVLGVVAYWPFQEWWMHKALLHLPPIKIGSRMVELDFAKKHRLHHEKPADIPLSFLPLPTIFVSLIAFSGFAYGVWGEWYMVATFMGTASFSTTLYEWTHYLTHTPYKPKSRFYRLIWKQHRWHHYKNEKYWYSFTIPWIDGWMGTGPDVKTVPKSDTARTLGREPTGISAESTSE